MKKNYATFGKSMPAVIARLFEKDLVFGFFGQALAFCSVVFAIIYQRTPELALQVFVSAIISILLQPATLAFPSIFPTVRKESAARESLFVSLSAFVVTFIVVILGLLPTIFLWPNLFEAYLAGLALFLTQGFYLFATTFGVRIDAARFIVRARFLFGCTLFLSSYVACGAWPIPAALIWPTSISFMVANFYLITRKEFVEALRAMLLNRTHLAPWGYIKFSRATAIASFIDSFMSQVPALMVSTMGHLSEIWALLTRFSGGVSTFGLQVLTPLVEASFSRGVRDYDFQQRSSSLRSGFMTGFFLLICFSIVSFVGLTFTSRGLDLSKDDYGRVVIMALSIYGVMHLVTPLFRFLALMGSAREKLFWSAGRFLGFFLMALLLPQFALEGLSIQTVVFAACYIALVIRAHRRLVLLNSE